MKKTISLLISTAILFFITTAIIQAESKTYTGVATPIITTTLQYGFNDAYRGIIAYTARPDQLVHGPTYNSKGEIIEEGTLLIQMDIAYRKAVVDSLKAKVKQDEDSLAIYKIQFDRYKTLVKTKAVSVEDYNNWENQYLVALNQLAVDKANLAEQEAVYKMCWCRSEYDGIVDTVFFPFGLPAAELAVMKMSQLNPMGIVVKMDRDTARKINVKTPVAIYPVNSNEPVGVANEYISLTEDGVKFRVLNYQLPPAVADKDGKPLPIVKTLPVTQLFATYPRSVQTGVPFAAVCSDEKGTYVWKGTGIKSLTPNKGYISSSFPVKKVYVKVEDVISKIAGYAIYQKLMPNDELERGDVVVIDPPKSLQDNDYVTLGQNRFLFMPGDNVKVVIGQ